MDKLGNQFEIGKSYFFLGTFDLIENRMEIKKDDLNTNINIQENKFYLGKFIGFQGFVWNNDWFDRVKAQFENGIISSGYYDKIMEAGN